MGCISGPKQAQQYLVRLFTILAHRVTSKKEPSIEASGIDVTKNGMHYDLIIFDDLHSEVNTQTKDQIDKAINHFKLAYSLLDQIVQ